VPLANRRAEKTIAIVFQIRLQLVRVKITFQPPASKICEKKSTLPTRQESETEIKFSCRAFSGNSVILHLPKFGAALVFPKMLGITKTTYIHVFVRPKTKSINFTILYESKVTFRGRKLYVAITINS